MKAGTSSVWTASMSAGAVLRSVSTTVRICEGRIGAYIMDRSSSVCRERPGDDRASFSARVSARWRMVSSALDEVDLDGHMRGCRAWTAVSWAYEAMKLRVASVSRLAGGSDMVSARRVEMVW